MNLQSLLEDNRLIWQKRTQEEILNSLLQKSHQYKLLGQRDEKLVMVFGKSHAGKTTLILSLMGIKEYLLKEILLILRAGVPEGNSSTSTAIIYQESDDDMFGVIEKTLSEVSNDVYKCDKNEFIAYLKKVRECVEQEKRSSEKVLYIYIPKYYFEENRNEGAMINILDVPGYETTNEKEKAHTNAVLSRFMTVSSLNIVVRSIYDINDLRYFVAPNRDDVHKLATSKYLIITTRSYSQENIFKYFLQPKSQRCIPFDEMIQNECQTQFKRICGESIPKVYPVDLGESFDELINTKIKDTEDRSYLLSYRNKVFSDILSVIKLRQNNSLKSWVDELLEDEEFYSNKELVSLIEEKTTIEKNRDEKEKALTERKGYLDQIEQNLDELETTAHNYRINLETIPFPHIEEITNGCVEEIKKTYFNENYGWKVDMLSNNVADLFENAFHVEVENYLLDLRNHDGEIYKELIRTNTYLSREELEIYFRTELDSKMNPQKGFLKVLNPSNKKKIENIGRRELYNSLKEYLSKLKEEYAYFFQKRSERFGEQLKSHIILKKVEEDTISGLENEIDSLGKTLDKIQMQIDGLKDRVEKDKETIKEYIDTAKKNYYIEKERIIKEMNNENSSVIKLEYVILLGLMQKDYEKLVMG